MIAGVRGVPVALSGNDQSINAGKPRRGHQQRFSFWNIDQAVVSCPSSIEKSQKRKLHLESKKIPGRIIKNRSNL